ncbi:MAG: proline dehydrogenase family protein [Methanomassiliicoccales archaeon]|nr:MAG: proline dehydrogenase family protein [Methanomassiliicoccales archaeon]
MPEDPERWTVVDIDDAISLSMKRRSKGIRTVLDLLGENIRSPTGADEVVRGYMELIDRISMEGLGSSISVKLSALGYMADVDGAFNRLYRISDRARSKSVGFELDMEWTPMVDHTIEVAEMCSKAGHPVTLAIQAYLNRSSDDIGYLQKRNIRVRLVKGAYRGEVSDFNEIQKRFVGLLSQLADSKKPFAIGTHDPDIMKWVGEMMIGSKDQIELGFLRGLSDATKYQFSSNGWKVAEYIPIGRDIKAYVGRREAYLKKLGEIGRYPAP